MKRIIITVICVLCLSNVISCQKVPAGYVGVKVYLLGGSKGVEQDTLGVGRYYIGINEELYLFPTFTQNYTWTQSKTEQSPTDEAITFQTKEGMNVSADVGISYRIDPTKVSLIFQKYRKGLDEITSIFLRNIVRDSFTKVVSSKPVEYVYGVGKTEILASVESMVKQQLESIGILIEGIYLVGELRLPPSVVASLNSKIEATQKAQQRENEVRESEAMAKKTVATARGKAESILLEAKAQAEANRILNESLTPTFIQYKSIEKWNGELPKFTGDKIPLISFD